MKWLREQFEDLCIEEILYGIVWLCVAFLIVCAGLALLKNSGVI